ncbi:MULTISPECIES: glycosyltransferase family 2 protein [Methanosarcina]|jgi:glycosyltransferase involved in cell wall biosynthesis|uniref:Glycosyl transferase family 2 n=3 Tax=Methanosarcina mazei TaxID=2209 RepID=A0A0F8IH28_METMZ|nr:MULTISPECIES: glycosyltransferase family 2 protein [Methanosarcina]AKB41415.1 Glycosyltransferase [Methanosarcina mazei WWM610]AKB69189.1 Glycosyltransferase [Methanosarcina mazei LYC]KKG06406.1 glycosyl transferase family 2 [Methanosarcina mazei]KKG33415.1 glycosyl transferase family 2 [Methanosarcina mazei]KKG49954.1 glycosyl transferase family 2 [Methanosarcina mazei]
MSNKTQLSIIIPVHNEEENILELYKSLYNILSLVGKTYEIIYVDDGSTDDSFEKIKSIEDTRVKVVRFQRNYGKAAALSCGFKKSKGDIVITMDGDLQDDPKEIPRFIEELDKYDMVSGWKSKRYDPISKTLPSRFFNWLTRFITGVKINDFNCGYKAYHNYVVKNINLYGEFHRYIPALAYWRGYSVGEIEVEHHPRIHGESKYGVERLLKGFLDLITVTFLMMYKKRPLHMFGGIGFLLGFSGVFISVYLMFLWIIGERIGERPLLMLGILLTVIGAQFVSLGLIGELITNSRNNDDYIIKYDSYEMENGN